MGLLDAIKGRFKKEKDEPIEEMPADAEPVPEALPEPEPYVEPEPIPTQQPVAYGPDLQLQQSPQPTTPAIGPEVKSKLEVINSKLDMLKMQLDNLNNSITMINAKIK